MAVSPLTYKEAGVDIEAGEALVERIKPIAARLGGYLNYHSIATNILYWFPPQMASAPNCA
jgi:phosphoribosylaminoimidazole (AIR) synthetase